VRAYPPRFTARFKAAFTPAFLVAAFAVCLACGAAGCVTKPTMKLNHAEVSGVQLGGYPPTLGVVMTVVVDVFNPNSYDVAIRAVRGQSTMAGRYIIPVDFKPPGEGVWLAAGRTTSVRVSFPVPVDIAIALAREGYMTPFIPYHLSGHADVTASHTFKLEADNYSIDEDGQITRDQVMAILPNTLFGPH
jgi:hypothetical protein